MSKRIPVPVPAPSSGIVLNKKPKTVSVNDVVDSVDISSTDTETASTTSTTVSPQYYHENGFLKVTPYHFNYCTWSKGRWIGLPLSTLFTREFRDRPPSYYRAACSSGLIRVNDSPVGPEYVIRPGDRIQHRIHRHEPPVLSAPSPTIIGTGPGFLVVNKPSSLPMHPSGRYRFLSLTELLRHQRPELFPSGHVSCVNRLDRLVSGVVVVSTCAGKADELRRVMEGGGFEKTYLARVRGDFRLAKGKRWFGEIGDSAKGKGESEGETESEKGTSEKTAEDTEASQSTNTLSQSTNTLTQSTNTLNQSTDTLTNIPTPTYACSAPLIIVEHKVGISTVADPSLFPTSKPSLTHITPLHYDPLTDSSLLLARPVTGRTHQIRIHLQYCGFPIRNDPLYGGERWGELAMSVEVGSREWFEGAQRIAQEMRSDADAEEAEFVVEDAQELCPDCRNPKGEPERERMAMDLHALRYEGPIGTFEAPIPEWALSCESLIRAVIGRESDEE